MQRGRACLHKWQCMVLLMFVNLRLPISGGIFSGPFKPRIATLSANAIVVAYERLDEEEREQN
eukprot:5533298-Amphidinium_carterae.2